MKETSFKSSLDILHSYTRWLSFPELQTALCLVVRTGLFAFGKVGYAFNQSHCQRSPSGQWQP
ncbi:hypothetical protein DSO57_1030674 [Entomophthora muscae]|uniref:Uncharacterized protein n=1 Tax=Entomophthora muscae TaxID=34485 RepID=A0ACC2RFJ6_9FUNG|nr:hypothetical protein DSO57_1030674 [Entomophthora muscae]